MTFWLDASWQAQAAAAIEATLIQQDQLLRPQDLRDGE